MSEAMQQTSHYTLEDIIELENQDNIRYELIDGQLYAMAGGKGKHSLVISNVNRLIGNHLLNTSCGVFSEMKIKVNDENFFIPDVSIDCDFQQESNFLITPKLIVEVLSESTRRIDETIKYLQYQEINSLEEYALIEQDFMKVLIYRKKQNSNKWLSVSTYGAKDNVEFHSINLSLPIEDIYHLIEMKPLVIVK